MIHPFAGPLPDSYWADPGRLLAGPLPRARDRAGLRAALRSLLGAGIGCVIDLRTPVEPPAIRSLIQKLDDDVIWVGHPILDGGAPSVPQMQAILDTIDAAHRRGRGVYVHCQGGRGRTGTVIACWWIRHGVFDLDAALDELSARRVGQPHGDSPSPETGVQYRLLRQWQRGE